MLVYIVWYTKFSNVMIEAFATFQDAKDSISITCELSPEDKNHYHIIEKEVHTKPEHL